MDVVAVPPLSSLPIDIATAIFKWIPENSIEACLLRQTSKSIKWILNQHMRWRPVIDPHRPFTHDLRFIMHRLPKPSSDDIETLKITALKRGQFENFLCLQGPAPVLSQYVIPPIKYGHIECVKQLLNACIDVELEDAYEEILSESARRGNIDLFVYAVGLRASALPVDENVVVTACRFGHLEMVKYLHFTLGLDMHTQGEEPIRTASAEGHLLVFQFLQSIGCDAHARGDAALIRAASYGHVDIVKHLVSTNTSTEITDRCFIQATSFDHLDVVTYLYSLGIVAVQKLEMACRSACVCGHLAIVKFLHSAGVDVHSQNGYGVRHASTNGHLEVVDFLCAVGAKVEENGGEALRMASKNGHWAVVKTLHKYGADVSCKDNAPILSASEHGHLQIVQFLHAHGANICVRLNAPLRFAARHGHSELVQFLHSVGANIRARNNEALHNASEHGHLAVVKYLHSAGVDIHSSDEYALRWACRNEHLEVANFLVSVGASIHVALAYAKRDVFDYKTLFQLLVSDERSSAT